jgi:hypothetical protein
MTVAHALFGIVIAHGIYYLIIQPLIGEGRSRHSSHDDRHHRR